MKPVISILSRRRVWVAGLGILVLGGYFLLRPDGAETAEKDSRAHAAPSVIDAPSAGQSNKDVADWAARIAAAKVAQFPELMKGALGIADSHVRNQVLAALTKKWLAEDMTGFIAFVDECEVDEEESGAIWNALVPAVTAALSGLPPDVASRPELGEIVRRLIENSARENPTQALAWAKEWLLDDALQSALATIAGEAVKNSPEQALQIFSEIVSPARRVDAINGIGAVYGATHPQEAAEWAQSLAMEAERPYAMNSVLASMAEVDAPAAADKLSAFREKIAKEYAAQREADVAQLGLAGVNETEAGSEVEQAANSELLPSLEDPQLGLLDEAAVTIARQWAAEAPDAAMAWAEKLPEGRLKSDVVDSALVGWAETNPDAAFAYYLKTRSKDAAPAVPLFEAWAQSSPQAAAEAAAGIQDPAIRMNAVSGVVSGWLQNSGDRAEIEKWVGQLPSARDRDVANAQIADALSFDEPVAAWQRAVTIQNVQDRREALKSAFASMVESDPSEARRLLSQAQNLTAEETKRLTAMLNAVTAPKTN